MKVKSFAIISCTLLCLLACSCEKITPEGDSHETSAQSDTKSDSDNKEGCPSISVSGYEDVETTINIHWNL